MNKKLMIISLFVFAAIAHSASLFCMYEDSMGDTRRSMNEDADSMDDYMNGNGYSSSEDRDMDQDYQSSDIDMGSADTSNEDTDIEVD